MCILTQFSLSVYKNLSSLLTVLFKGNIKQPSERFTVLLELVDCSIRVSHSSAIGKRDNVSICSVCTHAPYGIDSLIMQNAMVVMIVVFSA